MDDNDSDQFEDEEENEDDINIEDEDFAQFGVPVGEGALFKFIQSGQVVQSFQPRRKESNKTQSSAKKTQHVDPFRPRTPSLKNSFSQRKSTPIDTRKPNHSQVVSIGFDKRSEPYTHTHNTMNLEDANMGETMSNELKLN